MVMTIMTSNKNYLQTKKKKKNVIKLYVYNLINFPEDVNENFTDGYFPIFLGS